MKGILNWSCWRCKYELCFGKRT